MPDPWIVAGALLGLALLVPSVGLPLLLLLGGAAAVRVVALLLWETACHLLAPAPLRTLLRLRYVRHASWTPFPAARLRRLAAALAREAGLRLEPTASGELARLRALSRAVHATNRLAPPGLGPGLTWADVVEALSEVAPGLDVDAIARAEEDPPAPTGLHAARVALREAMSPWLPGAALTTTYARFALVAVLTERPHPGDLEDDPAAKERMLAMLLVQAAAEAGLRLDADTFPRLPLRAQTALIAAADVLYGTPAQAWRARLLHPSVPRLGRLAQLRRAVDARVEHIASAARAARAAEQAARATPLDAAEVAARLAAHRMPAILIRRGDPLAPPSVRSRLGGLPALPDAIPWPRHGVTGLPLHFLAQIDLSELPDLGGASPLPRRGTLLFFADLDEERQEAPDGSHTRVVFTDSLAPERPLPDDLPPIDHAAGRRTRSSARAFDPWPVTAHPVDSWRIDDAPAAPAGHPTYAEAARAAFERALRPYLVDRSGHRGSVDVPEGFPWTAALRDEVAARLRDELAGSRADLDGRLAYAVAPAAQTRLREAIERVDAELAALAPLLSTLGTPLTEAQADGWSGWLHAHPRRAHVEHLVRRAVGVLVRRAIGDPSLREGLPERLVAWSVEELAPALHTAQHLMLGPAQHKTNPTGVEGAVRLLCLDSDGGVEFMFCDMGVIEYWIDPEDLSAGRWERAVAHTAGG